MTVPAVPRCTPSAPPMQASKWPSTWILPPPTAGRRLSTTSPVQHRTSDGGTVAPWGFGHPAACRRDLGSLTNGTLYEFQVRATTSSGRAPGRRASRHPEDRRRNVRRASAATPGNTRRLDLGSLGSQRRRRRSPIIRCSTKRPPTHRRTGRLRRRLSPATGVTVTGLTNRLSYDFRVPATQRGGLRPLVRIRLPATPRTVPATPTGLGGDSGQHAGGFDLVGPGIQRRDADHRLCGAVPHRRRRLVDLRRRDVDQPVRHGDRPHQRHPL